MKKNKIKIYSLLLIYLVPHFIYAKSNLGYHYRSDKLKLNDHHYFRYVKPQLKNMLNEYFFIIKKITPLQESQKKMMKQIQESYATWNSKPTSCQHTMGPDCTSFLKKLYKNLRKLDLVVLEIKNKFSSKKFSQAKKKSKRLQNPLLYSSDFSYFTESLNQISLKTYFALHIVEESLIASQATSFISQFEIHNKLDTLLNTIKLKIEMSLTALLNKELRKDFDLVWIYFFKEINENILETNSKTYLLKNIENLSMTWNTFHMRMLKTRKSFPKNLKITIKTMHHRWNSILKIVLAR